MDRLRHQNYKNKITETKYLDNTQENRTSKDKNSLSQLKDRELGDREIKTRKESVSFLNQLTKYK